MCLSLQKNIITPAYLHSGGLGTWSCAWRDLHDEEDPPPQRKGHQELCPHRSLSAVSLRDQSRGSKMHLFGFLSSQKSWSILVWAAYKGRRVKHMTQKQHSKQAHPQPMLKAQKPKHLQYLTKFWKLSKQLINANERMCANERYQKVIFLHIAQLMFTVSMRYWKMWLFPTLTNECA